MSLIHLDTKTGRFFIDGKTPFRDDLIKLGWQQMGRQLTTDRPERVAELPHLWSNALKEALGQFKRAPLRLTAEMLDKIVPPGKMPLAHQISSIEYCLGGEATILGDPPGAGKTATNVMLANFWQPKTWLIICPASVKYNWKSEIDEWRAGAYDPHVYIINAGEDDELSAAIAERRLTLSSDLPAQSVVIINYDIVARYPWLRELIWDMATFDEAHKLKNDKSKRTEFCLGPQYRTNKAVAKIKAARRIFTTATPLNRPINLWPIVREADPKCVGANRADFVKRYCGGTLSYGGGYDERGASNTKELGLLLGESCYIMHDIDSILPPFREETIVFPSPESLQYAEQALYDTFFDQLEHSDLPKDEAAKLKSELAPFIQAMQKRLDAKFAATSLSVASASSEDYAHIFGETFAEQQALIPAVGAAFQLMAKIRALTGEAKIPHVIRYLKDLLEDDPDEQIVVMCHHKTMADALHKAFPKAAMIVGKTPSKKRQAEVKKFQSGETNLFIGNIAAAGEGITLTKSARLIFAEIDWNATSMWQALKRVHRISQTRSVLIEYILLSDTFDGYVARSIVAKRGTINEFYEGITLAHAADEGEDGYRDSAQVVREADGEEAGPGAGSGDGSEAT